MRERNLALPKQKAEAIEDVMPVFSAIRNPIQKRDSFDQAMNFLRVEDAILKRDLWKTVKARHASRNRNHQTASRARDASANDGRRTASS